MKVAITGAHGFVGWHLAVALFTQGHETVRLGRAETTSASTLAAALAGADAVVHCAGVNRGTDDEVMAGNEGAARVLAEALAIAPVDVVVYTNSSQIETDSLYGAAKRSAAHILGEAVAAIGSRFVDVVVPNVFGEWGRPNYNSFVATFAYNIANGNDPSEVKDRSIELIHVQDLADRLIACLTGDAEGVQRLIGHQTSIVETLELLKSFRDTYSAGVLPDLASPYERDLFNTYRSFLYPDQYPGTLFNNVDNRGHLVETVKTRDMGQAFVSSTKPGITRGNHFHRRKIERFVVLSGTADIEIRRVFTDDVKTFRVTGGAPCAIDIPTLHTHNITNVADNELLTFFWTNEIFDPTASDTYALNVTDMTDLVSVPSAVKSS
jgi:UDP-2-acetamido-2,6-beta-L-arabino-hexul-4-ose reductase